MAPDDLFGDLGDEEPPPAPNEGVRLISADEVEKVTEREGVAKRRRADEPKYGDRPPSPPSEARPTIRFPLSEAGDPMEFERPRVAPVEPRVAEGSVRPAAPAEDVTRVILGDTDEPVLDLGPSTGESLLPHWTEPATGQVPRVVIGDDAPSDPDEEERWSAYAGSTRWRDEHDTSEHGDLMADLADVPADAGEDHRVGALDTSERTSDEAYLNFDDVDLAPEAPTGRGRRGRRRSAQPPSASGGPIDFTGRAPDGGAAPLPPPPLPAVEGPAPVSTRRRATGPTATDSSPRSASGRSRLPATNPGPVDPALDPAAPRSRRRPDRDGTDDTGGTERNVPQAAAVGVVMAVVALIAFAMGPGPAMVIVTIVVALAGAEYFGAVQRGGFRPATLLGLVAVAVLPVATYWRGEAAVPLVMFLSVVVGVLWFLLGVGGKARPTANLGVTLLGIVWVGVLGSFAAMILKIPGEGVSILLITVVAAVAADVGGFFVGRSIGRTPLTPASPNKTFEGLVGGVVATLVAVAVVSVVAGIGPFSAGQALVFALVAAVVAPLGDLAESLLKRDLGLKDMGSLIPQHGGVLDRFDGLLFVLPTAYYLTRFFGLVV